MAKRTTPHSEGADTAPQPTPAQSKPRRSRGSITPRGADAGAPSEATSPAGTAASPSRAAQPTEDDIRRRAYDRYLERGGGHGMDFEDWLEAERELKDRKS